ncbi:S8 family serine peptidase [Paenibacillus athensensis]|nr:S8 family serine peptidase [Paenibacillus athensensis]MCD1260165.1 S8 family serine peptidase [Paenibacillus athensensis]
MKQRLISILLLFVLLFTFAAPPAAWAQAPAKAGESNKSANNATGYIIKFKDADKGRKALGKLNKKNTKSFRHLPKHATAALSPEEAQSLRQDPNVAYIEKDSLVEKAGDVVPPSLTQIHVPEAQAEQLYGDGVKVAVLDTGISATSPELRLAGSTSFVPNEPSVDDMNGHGTFVAGLVAALKDDQGLVGVAPHASLYNVKVLDGSGSGTYSQVIQAIEWAIDNHMDVVVMSFAGTEYSAALEEAMQDAYNSGILLVAAAGNAGTSTVAYPAKFNSVIGVGAVDSGNQRAPFSNTGVEVELVAPGVGVQGLSLHQGYVNLSGTSVAVPQVAGVAALLKSVHPDYTNQQLRSVLKDTATPLGPSEQYGSGLVNAAGALHLSQQTTPTPQPTPSTSPAPVESSSDPTGDVLTVAGLAEQYAIAESEIAAQLNLGYSLQEIRQALQAQATASSEMTLADQLHALNPAIQAQNGAYNYSATALEPQPDTYVPSYVEEAPARVTDDTYGTEQQVSIAADFPTSYDAFAVAQTSTKVDSAPYSVSSGAESISTVDGSLQIQSTDLTLPGRGGTGFALNRIYSSSDANYYDRRADSAGYYLTKCFPEFRAIIEQWQGGDTYTLYQDTTFYVYLFFQNNGYTTTINNPYPRYDMDHVEDGVFVEQRNREMTEFKARDAATDPPYATLSNIVMNGVTYRVKLYPTGHLIRDPGFVTSFQGIGYYNHNLPQDIENRFPIGKGWRWDIPYVEAKGGIRYVHLQGGASYELDASSYQLLNYPWKDLRMQRDYSTVTVGGINSYYVLISISGQRQYFSSDGRLLRMQDAYSNAVDFYYSSTSPFNLTKIKDALGNEINITYSTGQVTLTQGDRTVQYIKTKDPQGNKDLLTSVVDAGGRTTRYTYDIAPASYDLVGAAMKENYTALLKNVYHPTQARSVYTYETFTRSLGPTAKEQTSRIASREEAVDYVNGSTETFNHVNFTYAGDGGANVRYPLNFSTTRNDGLTQTTYSYKKSYLNDTTPSVFYNQKITQQAGTEKQETQQTFDEAHQRAVPTQVTVTHTSGTTVSPMTTITRTYDDYGNVTSETDPDNHTSIYTYDVNTHLLLSQLEPINSNLSRLVQYQRNVQGSVTQLAIRDASPAGAAGELKSQVNYAYDSFGNAVTVTLKDDNNRNTVINRSYGAAYSSGFLTSQSTSVTDVNGQASTITESMQYNASTGAMTKYTDGKGNPTNYQYDVLGRLTKATFVDNSQVNVTYDDVNNKVTAVDPTGLTTVTQWDPLGRKTSEGISGSGSVTYGYDAYGRTVWTQDALGHRTSFGYDAWGRLTQTVYPDGFSAGVTYDDVHFTVTTTDAESNQTRETYDVRKRLVKKDWLKASGPVTVGSYTYDFAGNLLTSTDGNQKTTNYSYDVLGRLSAVKDAMSQTTSYTYSLANKLTQVRYADGNTLQKQYDEAGRLIKSIDAAGQIDTYFYDANSNLTQHVDRKGQVQTNTYNNRNLLTGSQLGAETITYSYDAAGRRLTMKDATGTTTYAYDPVTKRASSVTFPDGKSIAYQFDTQGNRTQMTDPFGNTTVYGYDTRNRLTGVGSSVGNWDAAYTYKKNDLLAGVQQANGMNWTYGYDGANLVNLMQRKGSSTVVNSFSYGYDNNFNQTSKTENGTSSTYTYDPLNRIGTASPFQEQYSYDARGNRQTMQTSKAMNLDGASYTYDERNRLTQVTTEDGKTVSYRYNGDGMLYERTENGATTRYYYDGADMIAEAAVTGGTTTLQARYVRGNGLAARVDAAGSKKYYLSNGHGDVVGLADGSGNVINQYAYDLWGNPLTTSEAVTQPFRYSGEMWDSSTNLQYLRARWYDPSMGRFISEDSYEGQIDNPLSLNLYAYVSNNPLTHIDPSGHEAAPQIDWSSIGRQGLSVIKGGAQGAEQGAGKGGLIGVVVGAVIGALFLEPEHAGESVEDTNKLFANDSGFSILTADQAKNYKDDKNGNYVFRAITDFDRGSLLQGKGLVSKYTPPNLEWTLLQHCTWGGADSKGKDISIGHDPWIATTKDFSVAQRFNSGNGIVVIDLNKVNSEKKIPMYEFWGNDDLEGGLADVYGFAEQEISVYKYIPQSAIVGYVP